MKKGKIIAHSNDNAFILTSLIKKIKNTASSKISFKVILLTWEIFKYLFQTSLMEINHNIKKK